MEDHIEEVNFNNTYKIVLSRRRSRFANLNYNFICSIKIYDLYTNSELIKLSFNENDALKLMDILSAYISFGGYTTFMDLKSFSNNLTGNRIKFVKDVSSLNYSDNIIFCDVIGNQEIERLRLKFAYEDISDNIGNIIEYFDIFDFFRLLWNVFVSDLISIEELNSDFVELI